MGTRRHSSSRRCVRCLSSVATNATPTSRRSRADSRSTRRRAGRRVATPGRCRRSKSCRTLRSRSCGNGSSWALPTRPARLWHAPLSPPRFAVADLWPLQPVKKTEPPGGSPVSGPIDRFLEAFNLPSTKDETGLWGGGEGDSCFTRSPVRDGLAGHLGTGGRKNR